METNEIIKIKIDNKETPVFVVDKIYITDDSFKEKTTDIYLCYGNHSLFYYIINSENQGFDENHNPIVSEECIVGKTLINNITVDAYEKAISDWLEEQEITYRMILIKSKKFITFDQELAINNAITKIIATPGNVVHIKFDRNFASNELVKEFNLNFEKYNNN